MLSSAGQKKVKKTRRKDYLIKLYRQRSHESNDTKGIKPLIIFDEFDFVILKCLDSQMSAILCFEVSNKVGLALRNTTNHLKRLLKLRLITIKRSAQKKYVSINGNGKYFLKAAKKSIQDFLVKEEIQRKNRRSRVSMMKFLNLK